jgi:hypothetical protein
VSDIAGPISYLRVFWLAQPEAGAWRILTSAATADEASHFALLNFDLKRPFSKAFAFGA